MTNKILRINVLAPSREAAITEVEFILERLKMGLSFGEQDLIAWEIADATPEDLKGFEYGR